jgi:alkanesulfonate monooxygenase SsuD/methylene tetrahydromethanopterin reductase-like flavin-dependent oxidoreductase (luciferase family)
MRFGVHLANFGPVGGDVNLIARLARDAEKARWDGFFLWDHILGDPGWREPMVDPWIALAAAAAGTRRIRIGPLVTALPRRRPWHLARETASLDHLSGGRLILGVGLGNPPEAEYEHFGEDPDARRRARRLDEGLAILAGLWSGEPFAFHGREHRIRETVFLPTPIQRPRPPIWVAAHWPRRAPVRRAARWDGVFPEHPDGRRLSPNELAELLDEVRAHRDPVLPFDAVIAGQTRELGSTELAEYAAAGATWWLDGIMPNVPLDEVEERIAAGPPTAQVPAPAAGGG